VVLVRPGLQITLQLPEEQEEQRVEEVRIQMVTQERQGARQHQRTPQEVMEVAVQMGEILSQEHILQQMDYHYLVKSEMPLVEELEEVHELLVEDRMWLKEDPPVAVAAVLILFWL
jgi:hypothetical protein